MFKIVDGSAKLGIQSRKIIDTKEKLYEIVKQHFIGLVSGDKYNPKTDDEKLFWALSTIYVVENDCIYLCDRINVGYPIFDVEVCKSDKTSVIVKPYKIDYYKEHEIDKINYVPMTGYKTVDPLDVMGYKSNTKTELSHLCESSELVLHTNYNWEGTIWVRSAFTGWNTIDIKVDIDAIFKL